MAAKMSGVFVIYSADCVIFRKKYGHFFGHNPRNKKPARGGLHKIISFVRHKLQFQFTPTPKDGRISGRIYNNPNLMYL